MKKRLDFGKILLKAQKYLSDGILIFDANQKGMPLVFLNKIVKKILGYPMREIIGKDYKFLICEDSDKENIAKIHNCFLNKHACTMDLIIKRKDGKKIYCRICITPIPNLGGKIEYFICILRDITEIREKLKNKLKLSIVEATLRSVNDIVFNYMNMIQLFRMDCEENVAPSKVKFKDWDKNHQATLLKLKKLNELKEVKERKISGMMTVLNYN